jgi:alpha-1,2-mannosyltransferase
LDTVDRPTGAEPSPESTLRTHAVALTVVLWAGTAWLVATPGMLDRFGQLKAPDFAQFYTAGLMVAEGRVAALYDWPSFAEALKTVPSIRDLLYLSVYPPQVALLFAPLAKLSYVGALLAWTLLSGVVYALVVWSMLRGAEWSEAWLKTLALLAAGNPALQQTLLNGQISVLALAVVALAWLAWQRNHRLLAGVALGSLVFKPQLLTIAIAAMLLAPSVRLAAGIAVGILAQLALAAGAFGPTVLMDYAAAAGRVLAQPEGFEPKTWQLHSLKGAVELLLGHSRLTTTLWLVGVAVTLLLARRAVSRTSDRGVIFSIITVTGVMIDPHLYAYDLVILVVPFALIADSARRGLGVRSARLAYALYWAPLVGMLAAATHVQLTSALAMAWLWACGSERALRAGDERARSIDRPGTPGAIHP